LVHCFAVALLSQHFSPIINSPSSEEENGVCEEALSKHTSEDLEHSFEIFVNSRVLRVEGDNERVNVLNLLDGANHLSDVLCVSPSRISEAWGIKDEDFVVIRITKPVRKDTFSLIGMGVHAGRSFKVISAAYCVAGLTLARACCADEAYRLVLSLDLELGAS